MADNLSIATLLPAAAIRPIRPAELVNEVRMEEKVSDYYFDVVSLALELYRHHLRRATVSLHPGVEWLERRDRRTVLSMTSWARALS